MASESDDKATEIGSGPNLNNELPQENIDSTEYKEFLEESSSLEPIDNPDVLAQKDKDIINQDPELKSVHNTLEMMSQGPIKLETPEKKLTTLNQRIGELEIKCGGKTELLLNTEWEEYSKLKEEQRNLNIEINPQKYLDSVKAKQSEIQNNWSKGIKSMEKVKEYARLNREKTFLEIKVIDKELRKLDVEKNFTKLSPSELARYNQLSQSRSALQTKLEHSSQTQESQTPMVPSEEESQEAKDKKQQEAQKSENKEKERRETKAAIIAGIIGGGTGLGTALAVGASAVPQIRTAAMIGTLVAGGTSFIAKIVENKTAAKLKTETNPEERAKLEKRIKNWEKVSKWARNAGVFLGGFSLGLFGGSLISAKFMGGYGFLNKPNVSPEITSGIPQNNISTSGPKTIEQSPIDTTHATSVVSESTSSTFDTGLVQNGKVNIPGEMPWGGQSSWNGNLVGPEGGASGRAAEFINEALKANKLKASQFQAEDLHRLMYDAEQQIIKGQTPVFKTLLEQGAASDIPNAAKILSLIK